MDNSPLPLKYRQRTIPGQGIEDKIWAVMNLLLLSSGWPEHLELTVTIEASSTLEEISTEKTEEQRARMNYAKSKINAIKNLTDLYGTLEAFHGKPVR